MSVETHLKTEIEAEFTKLSTMEPGSEKYKVTVDGVTKLMDRLIDMDKVEIESTDRVAARESEERLRTQQMESEELLRKQQMEDEKKDRLVKNIIGAAGVLLPLAVTIWGTKVSLKFEEEGTFTTMMGRGFINKLLPKK